jgi:hypothetical protein
VRTGIPESLASEAMFSSVALRAASSRSSTGSSANLALCGLTATGHPAALAGAVDTFGHARRITTAPGIVHRTLTLLDQIAATTHHDQLAPARTAAAGPEREVT